MVVAYHLGTISIICARQRDIYFVVTVWFNILCLKSQKKKLLEIISSLEKAHKDSLAASRQYACQLITECNMSRFPKSQLQVNAVETCCGIATYQ